MHVYVSQTDRGEFLIGAEIEPYTTYKSIGTFPFLEYSARHVLELFPQLERLNVLRTWTGLCDLSPDYSPILGRDRGRELPRLGRLGHLRLQGGADRRHDARRARRDGQDARPDRAVRARALPHRHARLRAGGRGRLALDERHRRRRRGRHGRQPGPRQGRRRGARRSRRAGGPGRPLDRPVRRRRLDPAAGGRARAGRPGGARPAATILVNAAGIFGPLEPFRDTDPAAWVETMMVDAIGPYLTCRAFVGGCSRPAGGGS